MSSKPAGQHSGQHTGLGRALSLEIVRVTEQAAVAAARLRGRDGHILRGVQFGRDVIETETVVMRSTSGTIRWIRAEHRQLGKFR
jgi:fructose-1,6-bisphosphatase/sedoheptulose 1,7-bisphosphatase-like protein